MRRSHGQGALSLCPGVTDTTHASQAPPLAEAGTAAVPVPGLGRGPGARDKGKTSAHTEQADSAEARVCDADGSAVPWGKLRRLR